jgi:hypothetical protein
MKLTWFTPRRQLYASSLELYHVASYHQKPESIEMMSQNHCQRRNRASKEQPTFKFDTTSLAKYPTSAINSSVFVIIKLSSFQNSATGRVKFDAPTEKG